jgi:hypothetical protein
MNEEKLTNLAGWSVAALMGCGVTLAVSLTGAILWGLFILCCWLGS